MKTHQLVLDLRIRPLFGRQDFFVASCNKEAVALIDDFPYVFPGTLVYGPHGAGKTHLAHLFADVITKKTETPPLFLKQADLSVDMVGDIVKTAKYIVMDDIVAGIDENAFFHLLNVLKNAGGFVFMTSQIPYSSWNISLPDLKSRLAALPTVALGMPDDTVMQAVLLKLFADRQLEISPAALTYLLKNMERTFAAAEDIVDRADKLSLAEKKQITIPLLGRVLNGLLS